MLRNVVGLLRGSDPVLRESYVVVSAHYDHVGVRPAGEGDSIYNGANDNASGVAMVMEAARVLGGAGRRPKRSLVFLAVFGEESGMLGSTYYCQHPVVPLDHTAVNVNFEQLGRTDDTEGPRLRQFNLTGFDFTDLGAAFSRAARKVGIQAVKHPKNSDAYFGGSDNLAFALRGIPSTTISVTYSFPDYHRAGDEWQKIDFANMAAVGDAIVRGLVEIANARQAPAWNRDNPGAARFATVARK
jgi:Zn-dependent M28 family amino/carboxypeptidase